MKGRYSRRNRSRLIFVGLVALLLVSVVAAAPRLALPSRDEGRFGQPLFAQSDALRWQRVSLASITEAGANIGGKGTALDRGSLSLGSIVSGALLLFPFALSTITFRHVGRTPHRFIQLTWRHVTPARRSWKWEWVGSVR